jgi:LmbE family N-acetylglucosaminyl deacetylase
VSDVAPRRVLAVGAHPDDVEFGCGATIARWAAGGAAVHVAVLTDGSKGSWDVDLDIDELAAERRYEQLDAADALGAAGVEFLDLVDGELQAGPPERAALCAVIRRLQPDTLLGHDPWKRYRLHPDHREAGQLLLDAVVAARDPHFFPEQGPPHRPERLLLFEAEVVDHVEDAGPGFDAKLAALLAHRTQWRSTMGIEADSPHEADQRQAFEARIRGEASTLGTGWGLELAEGFKRLEPL